MNLNIKKTAALILLLIFTAAGIEASSNINEVYDIQVNKAQKEAQINLIFSNEYQETAKISSLGSGWLRVNLPNSNFAEKFEFTRVNDGFIRALRMFHSGSDSILEVEFASQDFHANNLLQFVSEGSYLKIIINKDLLSKKTYQEAEKLVTKKNQVEESLIKDQLVSENWAVSIAKMLVALLLVLVMLYFFLWFFNKFFATRFKSKKGKYSLKIVSSHHISPKQKVVVLEVNGTAYALAVTPTNISLISHPEVIPKNGGDNSVGGEGSLRGEYLQAMNQQKKQAELPEKAPKFGDDLLKKVKKLRPID